MILSMLLELLLVVCVLSTRWHASAAGWHVVRPQSPDSGGTDTYPSIRYGHSLAYYNGSLITTHGYYYDRERGNATWLSDTWALDVTSAATQSTWQRLSGHLPQAEAHGHYSRGSDPRAPCGRFGFAAAIIGDALLLHGGNDGGYSRTNRQDYKPGYDFDELWRFNLTTHSWRLLRPRPYGGGPGRRYLAAAAAVQGSFLLYGGTIAGQGDVWSYSLAEDRWERLAEEVPRKAGGPGRRMGASLTPWVAGGTAGVVLYGGRADRANGSSIVHRDAWFFDLADKSWRRLTPVAGAQQPAAAASTDAATDTSGGAANAAGTVAAALVPPGRLYHAAMDATVPLPAAAGDGGGAAAAGGAAGSTSAASSVAAGGGSSRRALRLGVIAGGTLTSPGLKCAKDAWVFSLDCSATKIAWARLPDLPAALYDTRGAAGGAASGAAAGAAFVFGGHLCSLENPPAAPYPYYYVNEVLRLDLSGQVEALAALSRGAGSGDGGGNNGVACACELAHHEATEGAPLVKEEL